MSSGESPSFVPKVVVHLRATGDAPILNQAKFKFVYVNTAFSPNPDESVTDLHNNFGFDGKLVVMRRAGESKPNGWRSPMTDTFSPHILSLEDKGIKKKVQNAIIIE